MKRTVTGIVGFLAGMAIGVALLLLNPVALTRPLPPVPAGSLRTLTWPAGEFRGIAITPQSLLGLGRPAGANRAFPDPGIRYARAEVAALPDDGQLEAGPVLAIRLSALARDNSLLRARLGVATNTNILWPAEGSVFLAGSENLWAPLRDGVWSAVRGRGFRPGKAGYPLPPVAGVANVPVVIGAGGRFAAAHGSYRETLVPDGEHSGNLAARRELQIGIE